ncbi:hypothetical protein DPMN_147323 [Dreissena polymorpha]|uniref:Uncharacterized protein n=1 Tax=Dreissena polymorpha TaxID=45954 RepID=A0A9D4F9N7_DREPO|nr:hypothetical protein DPMN_147323 [Dreissena polymorpha]
MLYQYMLSLQAHGTVYDQANYLMCYVKCKVAIATRQAGDKKREGNLEICHHFCIILEEEWVCLS